MRRSELYWQYKSDGRCTQCGVDLPEDSTSTMCSVHTAAKRARKSAWVRGGEGAAYQRTYGRALYSRRKAAADAGEAICVKCGTKSPSRRCARCRASNTAATRAWRARKAQGVTPIARARRIRVVPAAGGDRLADPARTRILRGLRFLDWTAAAELYDLLEVDAGDKRERDRFAAAISRLVRTTSFVDRRKAPGFSRGAQAHYEYQITERGRAGLARELR